MTLAILAALLLYGVVSAFLILHTVHHRVITLLLLQYVVVLPAVVLFLRRAGDSREWKGPPKSIGIAIAVLVVSAAAVLSVYVYPGVTVPDEQAYQFQARVFASGRLYAEPLPGSTSPNPVPIHFEHHIVRDGKWFAKYPPGWPAILAVGVWLHLVPLVNPFFGAVLAALAFYIARKIFDDRVACLAVLFLVLSPFFLANIAGTMAHASCAVMVTLAGYFCLLGLRDLRIRNFVAAFALVGVACQIRPMTGFATGLALGGASLFLTRHQPRVFFKVLAAGGVVGALIAASILAINYYQTGNAFVSPYALSLTGGAASEFAFKPSEQLRNAIYVTRWGILRTVLYTVPFTIVLVAYALFRDTEKRAAVITATLPFLFTILLYNVESEGSGSYSGERYYFESFCLACIVAARGFILLLDRWRPSQATVTTLVWAFAALQLCQHAVAIPNILDLSYVSRQVHQHVAGGPRLVFLKGPEAFAAFIPKHANWNVPDWRHADRVYLVDPGPLDREAWAKRLGEAAWRVLGYDDNTKKVSIEEGRSSLSYTEH